MKKFLLALSVLFVGGCEGNSAKPTSREALDPLRCAEGQVAYNFTRFPGPLTAEAQSQSTTTSVVPSRLPRPNVVRIESATCNGGTNWTELFKESCEGSQECAFSRSDCAGPTYVANKGYQGEVRVTYACSDTPSDRRSQVCNPAVRSLDLCVFQIKCTQSPAVNQAAASSDRVECVPAVCNVGTKRDANMQCVADFARPTEYKWGWNEALQQPSRMQVFIDSNNFNRVYPSIRNLRGTTSLELNTATIDFFSEPDFPAPAPFTNAALSLANEARLAQYGVLAADTLYDVRATVSYAVKPGTDNRGMQGVLALWLYDEYQKGSQATEKAFRCLMHSVDMAKYGPGTRVGTSHTYRIEISEQFVIPRDCREDSAMYYESQGLLYRPKGLSAVEFGNTYKRARTTLTASYDLEGKVILVDDFTDATKKITCAVNPSDFYYNQAAGTHDRYQYYLQREIPLIYQRRPAGSQTSIDRIEGKLGNGGVYVQEANLTTLGLSAVRPKQLVTKVRTVGAARGFLRADYDWYLSGDRHRYWQNGGLQNYPVLLKTYLVPLNSDDSPKPENQQLLLGETRVMKSTPYGETLSARFPITEELRNRFITPGGPFEATKQGTKFKLRTCLQIGDGSLSFLEAPQYTLQINSGDTCRTTAAPFLIRVDRSVAPLEPFSGDDLSESSPATTGDARMSNQVDNDQSRECDVTDGGVEICRTGGAAGSEGQGSFGGTLLKTDNAGYSEGSQKVVVDKQIELAGFEVLDDEEEKPYEAPDTKISFSITPDWDRIAAALGRTIPGPRFESKTEFAGVKGLSISLEFKVPVRYGPLQGTVVYGIGTGAGLELVFEYTLKNSTSVQCANGECQALYTLLSSRPYRDVLDNCYSLGGRLAELSSVTEAGFLRAEIPQGGRVWIGGQVANEYALPACLTGWQPSRCSPSHITSLRWLSNDEDFAEARSFGDFTIDANQLPNAGAPVSVASIASARPVPQGVSLGADNVLELRNMTESLPGVCKFRNTASVTSHSLKASLEVVIAGAISLAFCTPSEEFGVCLEGSLNIVESKIIPSVEYTHHNLKDASGRRGIQSAIKLSLDYEVNVLSGEVLIKVVLGPWFSFKYNLFSFRGLKLPLGGNLAESEYPQKEDFK